MMRMKTKLTGLSPLNGSSDGGGSGRGGAAAAEGEWEMRPGGMLVQRRNPDSDQTRAPPPTIRVRVKYGSIYHEINISSQATFGELKKMLTGPTGLHHQDQKLLFKDKERDSNAFLDITGVKDRSKIVVVEDPISQEKRLLEMRRNAKMEKASKSISEISLEIDRLAGQVSAFESVISKGGKVAEKDLVNLTELLMNQLLKLDGIVVDGDVKLQRKMQVKRVQKHVETLDMLKIKNSTASNNGSQTPTQTSPIQQNQQQRYSNGQTPTLTPQKYQQNYPNGQILSPSQQQQGRHSFGHLPEQTPPLHQQQQQQQQQPSRHSASSGPVVITTRWETFDSFPATVPAAPCSVRTTNASSTNNNLAHSRFNWDLL